MPIQTGFATNIAGIPCYDESCGETIGRDGTSAKRVILCAWSNRITLAISLVGTVTASGTVVTVVDPSAYPDATWIKASNVETEMVPGSQGLYEGTNHMVAADYARLTVTYGNKEDSGGDGQERGEEGIEFAGEVITFSRDESTFKWETDDKKLSPEVSPGAIIPTMAFTKTKKGLKSIPRSTLLDIAQNPVNNATFLGIATEKVRFDGAQTSRTFTTDGTPTWTMTCKFSARPISWNKFFRPDSTNTGSVAAMFEYLSTISGSNRVYGLSSFSALGLE